MDKSALELELREVEARMELVTKDSRAYRVGLVIRASILNELARIEEEQP